MSTGRSQLIGECLAEMAGIFAIILVGDGVVAAAVLIGAYDPIGVAWMWGLAVMIGVYVAGGVSGAHLNPAVTLVFSRLSPVPQMENRSLRCGPGGGGLSGRDCHLLLVARILAVRGE